MVIGNLRNKARLAEPVVGYLAIVLVSEILEKATGNEARKEFSIYRPGS